MKRCATCSFIYNDNDSHCDFDGTALSYFDDAEIDVNKNVESPELKPKIRRTSLLVIVASVCAFFLVAATITGLFVFFRLKSPKRPIAVAEKREPEPPLLRPVTPFASQEPLVQSSSPTSTPTTSPSPVATHTPVPTPQPTAERTTRATISKAPVSTSNEDRGKHPALIRLNTGATIEADEVWRTRDGLWYRRNGMVTLLKANGIRSISRK